MPLNSDQKFLFSCFTHTHTHTKKSFSKKKKKSAHWVANSLDSLLEAGGGSGDFLGTRKMSPCGRYPLHFAVPPEHVPQADNERRYRNRSEQQKLDDVLKQIIQQ